MNKARRTVTVQEKGEAVLESFQRDTTLDDVCKKYGIYCSLLLPEGKEFRDCLPDLFGDKPSSNGREKAA
jgi:transposase-like protein